MSERERNTDFLKRMILFAHPDEHRKLEADISQVRRKQHCVQRAAQLMILFGLISAVALGYGAVLEENCPRFFTTFICGLGLASPVCLAFFLVLLVNYRRELNRLLEECRQLIAKIMKDRLGRVGTTTFTGAQAEDGDPGLGHLYCQSEVPRSPCLHQRITIR